MDTQMNSSGDSTVMSSPSLKTWFQTQIESLYAIPPQTDSQQALFSWNAQILVNYEPVTLEQFYNNTRSQLQFSRQTSVSWKDVIEVPNSQDDQNEVDFESSSGLNPEIPQGGIVAGIFVLTRSLNFRVRAGPAQRKTTVVFSAKIQTDPTVHDGDARRVVHLHQTEIDEAVPVHIQGIGSQQEMS